ncbi:Ankyrin-2 [Xylographa trunciseda]|nr:Ankyrin-2 [Xylographa trunciseda]
MPLDAEIDLERGEVPSTRLEAELHNEKSYPRILLSLKAKAQNAYDPTEFLRLLAQIDGIGSSEQKKSRDMSYLLPLVVGSGSLPMVEGVLARCHDVDVRSPWKDRQTALYAACNTSPANPAIVKCLLERGAKPNSVQGSKGSPLHVASIVGCKDIVKLLLEYDAQVNLEGEEYHYALQAAAYFGRTQIVKLLLSANAYVNAVGAPYGTALMAALAGYSGSEICPILLGYGADVSITYCGQNVLMTAANWSRPDNKKVLPTLLNAVKRQNAQGPLDDGLIKSYKDLSADSKTPFIQPMSSSSPRTTLPPVHSGTLSTSGRKKKTSVVKKLTEGLFRKTHNRDHADHSLSAEVDSGDESDVPSNSDGEEGRDEPLPAPHLPPMTVHDEIEMMNVPDQDAENAYIQADGQPRLQSPVLLGDYVPESDQKEVTPEKQWREALPPTSQNRSAEPVVSPEVISRLWSTAQLMSLTNKFYASNFQTLQIFSLLNLQHQLVELNDNFQTDVNIGDPEKVLLARKLLKEYYQELRDWRSASTFPTATGAESNLITDFLASSLRNDAYHSLAETKRTLILDSNPPVDAVRRFLSSLCRAHPWATDPNETARDELRELLRRSNLQTDAAVLLSQDVDRSPRILPLVDRLARLLVALAGAALLVVPMAALNSIDVEWGRILAVALFVLAFALGLGACSQASNQELVAASAAYGAVLVIYIGHVAGAA